MILLLGFKMYDEGDCEYQVTDADARRLAAVCGHPGADKVVWANVTFYHQGVDFDADPREIERARARDENEQLTILQGSSD